MCINTDNNSTLPTSPNKSPQLIPELNAQQLLLHHHTQHPSPPPIMKVLSSYKKISLWLLPPEPILSHLSCMQQQLISFHMSSPSSSGWKKKRLPTFIPHVTLVGGISISECCTVDNDVLPLLQLPQQQQRDGANTWRDGVDDSADEKKEEDYVVEQQNDEDDDVLDEVAAKSVLIRLTNAFCNFGGVECAFVKERGVFAARRRKEEGGDNGNNNSNDNKEGEGEVQWNQSCISIMERTDSFTKAVELADQVLLSPTTTPSTTPSTTTTTNYNEHGHDNEHDQLVLSTTSSFERHLKPPTCEPHYSFVYGNDASLISSLQPPSSSSRSSSSSNSSSDDHVSSSSGGGIMKKKNDDLVLQCPPDFTSTEIAVMWTYPSTLEGVEQWREIGRFSLVKEEEGVTQSKY